MNKTSYTADFDWKNSKSRD